MELNEGAYTLARGFPPEPGARQETPKETKIDATAEYFKRYERKPKGEGGTEQEDLGYWLSEDEEEKNHQLQRQRGEARLREPYVVRDAKSPKLRPAEGEYPQHATASQLMNPTRRVEAPALGS
jgi:hypothetical protein